MELSEAMELTKVVNPIPLDELSAKLEAHHGPHSQLNAIGQRGLALIREGLQVLAGLGHQLEVVPKFHGAVLQYPKMLHRLGVVDGRQGVESKVVESSDAEDEAKEGGWVEHPDGFSGRRPTKEHLAAAHAAKPGRGR